MAVCICLEDRCRSMYRPCTQPYINNYIRWRLVHQACRYSWNVKISWRMGLPSRSAISSILKGFLLDIWPPGYGGDFSADLPCMRRHLCVGQAAEEFQSTGGSGVGRSIVKQLSNTNRLRAPVVDRGGNVFLLIVDSVYMYQLGQAASHGSVLPCNCPRRRILPSIFVAVHDAFGCGHLCATYVTQTSK